MESHEEILTAMVGIYYENGNVDGLVNIVNSIESYFLDNPNNLFLKHTLADVYMKIRNFDKAFKVCKEISGEEETDTFPYLINCVNIAECLGNTGFFDEAKKLFKQVIAKGKDCLLYTSPSPRDS